MKKEEKIEFLKKKNLELLKKKQLYLDQIIFVFVACIIVFLTSKLTCIEPYMTARIVMSSAIFIVLRLVSFLSCGYIIDKNCDHIMGLNFLPESEKTKEYIATYICRQKALTKYLFLWNIVTMTSFILGACYLFEIFSFVVIPK